MVWASVKHLLDDGLSIPEMGYLETCHPDMGDGLNRLMLSQLRTAGGILLEYLHCRKRSYFVAQAAAKQLEIPCEAVNELLKALEERQILRSMKLELESGEVNAYELAEPAAFVPFLYIARCFMQTGMNYICVGNYDMPLLQKEKWKERVAIARALLHNRSILLVDESTSALDQENADRLEKNLLSKPELTLILVSHHLSSEQKKRFTQVFTLSGAS